jgi:hypothetical protein
MRANLLLIKAPSKLFIQDNKRLVGEKNTPGGEKNKLIDISALKKPGLKNQK